MGKFMKKFANFQDKKSISYKLRKKRMQLLEDYVLDNFGPDQRIEILDLGGTQAFWKAFPSKILQRANVTLVNLTLENVTEPNFTAMVGDARSLPQFRDKQFDLVFSNSVIEHVGNFDDQEKMANEIIRVGKKHFIQTPNRNFPLEPHFLFPFFQFLPMSFKIFLVTHWAVGQYTKAETTSRAYQIINSVNLLNFEQIGVLFPGSLVMTERVSGLSKSFIVCE